MGRSFLICNLFGIPLKVHWSFGLMVLFITYVIYLQDLSIEASIGFALLVVIMFVCVILHELGHSLAARRYGIETLDIIISPIGGLARLKSIPEQPLKELVIALAGPAVNVIIALFIGIYLRFIVNADLLPSSDNFELLAYSIDFLKFVFTINIMLFVFNLVPAFPMDGGRVLRALLSLKFERVLATQIAMWIARTIAFLFILLSFHWHHIILGIIGVFVYILSGKEYNYVKLIKKSSTKISEIFRTEFSKILVTDDYKFVVDIFKKGREKNFLVFDNKENVIGSLPEVYLKDAIKNLDKLSQISQLMSPTIVFINPNETLREVSEMMNENGIAICAVKKDDRIIGVLDRNDIRKFMRT